MLKKDSFLIKNFTQFLVDTSQEHLTHKTLPYLHHCGSHACWFRTRTHDAFFCVHAGCTQFFFESKISNIWAGFFQVWVRKNSRMFSVLPSTGSNTRASHTECMLPRGAPRRDCRRRRARRPPGLWGGGLKARRPPVAGAAHAHRTDNQWDNFTESLK